MTKELIERLREGVREVGLHEDNSTELFDVDGATELMAEAADRLQSLSDTVERLARSVGVYREVERACPANKRALGEKPCPKCGATPDEPCRETVRAAYAVVDEAKALAAHQEHSHEQ